MSEIVVYDNYMNTIKFDKFTATDLNVLMAICSQMTNKGQNEVELSYKELRSLMHYTVTSQERFEADLTRMYSKLQKISFKSDTETTFGSWVLFPTFEGNKEKKTLKVGVHEKLAYILNELSGNFTRFELEEFVSLESKFTKNLYRQLKQYRNSGVFVTNDIEWFRNAMDCPASYSAKYFYNEVIKPAVEELSEKNVFSNLRCEPQRGATRGRPVIGYKFCFDKDTVAQHVQEKKETTTGSKTTKKKAPESGKPNRFHNYQQRDTDYDKIIAEHDPLMEEAIRNFKKSAEQDG